MSKVEVIVKVERDRAERLTEIAAECRAAGMSVDSVMRGVGMISGAIDAGNINKLEKIEGVSYVEESKPISLES